MPDQLQPALTSAVDLATAQPLSDDEARYVQAARSANTLRGYRSDWNEFSSWCAEHNVESLPATAAAISGYLTVLAGHGAKVGTMSRRLSAIRLPTGSATCPTRPRTPASSPSGKGSAAPTPPGPSRPHR